MTATAEAVWTPAPEPGVAAPLCAVDEWHASWEAEMLTVTARVGVRGEELGGHFPGLPIFPGVFVIEALSQAMAVVGGQVSAARPRLRSLRSARFLAPLFGGDELTLVITARRQDGGWDVTATGSRADGTTAARIRADFDTVGVADA
jgi:3-hydroxyacyl-[acyl-carrier-protein] dehydratase